MIVSRKLVFPTEVIFFIFNIMTIMRSEVFWSMSMILSKKYKRRSINWYEVLFDIEDKELHRRFYAFKNYHKSMSWCRCALYVLQSYYSTTSIERFKLYVSAHNGHGNPNWFFVRSL